MKMERPVLRTFLVSNYSFREDVKEIFVSLSNSRKTLKLLGMAKLAFLSFGRGDCYLKVQLSTSFHRRLSLLHRDGLGESEIITSANFYREAVRSGDLSRDSLRLKLSKWWCFVEKECYI